MLEFVGAAALGGALALLGAASIGRLGGDTTVQQVTQEPQSVPTSLTTNDVVFTTAQADYTFTEELAAKLLDRTATIHLTVTDDGSTPMVADRDFTVVVGQGGSAGGGFGPSSAVAAGCSASGASAASAGLALIALVLLRRKR